MEIFQKIGDVANKTCKMTSEHTNKFVTTTKLKWQMNDYKAKIKVLYEDLGKVIYEKRVREDMEDAEERIENKCKEIDILAGKIEECRMNILKTNNITQCKNCYAEIYAGYNFCPNCGEKQREFMENEQHNTEKTSIEVKLNEDDELEDKVKENYSEGEETKKIDINY